MEVSCVQHCTEWEQGSSASCFYVLLSEDVVGFLPWLYSLCYCTVSLYLNSIGKYLTSDAAQGNIERYQGKCQVQKRPRTIFLLSPLIQERG